MFVVELQQASTVSCFKFEELVFLFTEKACFSRVDGPFAC